MLTTGTQNLVDKSNLHLSCGSADSARHHGCPQPNHGTKCLTQTVVFEIKSQVEELAHSINKQFYSTEASSDINMIDSTVALRLQSIVLMLSIVTLSTEPHPKPETRFMAHVKQTSSRRFRSAGDRVTDTVSWLGNR